MSVPASLEWSSHPPPVSDEPRHPAAADTRVAGGGRWVVARASLAQDAPYELWLRTPRGGYRVYDRHANREHLQRVAAGADQVVRVSEAARQRLLGAVARRRLLRGAARVVAWAERRLGRLAEGLDLGDQTQQ